MILYDSSDTFSHFFRCQFYVPRQQNWRLTWTTLSQTKSSCALKILGTSACSARKYFCCQHWFMNLRTLCSRIQKHSSTLRNVKFTQVYINVQYVSCMYASVIFDSVKHLIVLRDFNWNKVNLNIFQFVLQSVESFLRWFLVPSGSAGSRKKQWRFINSTGQRS